MYYNKLTIFHPKCEILNFPFFSPLFLLSVMGARNLARKEMFRKLWCFLAACCFLSHPSIVWCSVVVDVVPTKAVKKKAKENICILYSSSIFSALLYILTTISVKLCHPLPPPRKRRQTSSLGFQWRPECYRCARKHTGVCPISAFIFFLHSPELFSLTTDFHWSCFMSNIRNVLCVCVGTAP